MDGFKARLIARLNGSLQFRLSFFLSLVILVVALIAGTFSFVSAFEEAHELQDDTLRQIAAMLDHRAGAPLHSPAPSDGDEETHVTVQWLPGAGSSPGKREAQDLPLPAALKDGLQTVAVDGEDFRVLVRTTGRGERVAVSQETGMRDDIARASALRTVMPCLLLAPILVLLVANLVRRIFRPIATLSDEVNARSEFALHPIEAKDVPVEIRPFLEAINGLLAKVQQGVAAQRRFLADAAHELRSPLTALSLQSERLTQTEMSEAARERLTALRHGIERGRNLIDQLLTLARVQSTQREGLRAISVLAVYRRVIEDVMPLAEAKEMDVGLLESDEVCLTVNEMDLFTMVKNIVDNAIRYTPSGGAVDLRVRRANGMAELTISDSGPGIPESERSRIFDPFYRPPGSEQSGSGLGLAIVKEIADRMGATVNLSCDEAGLHRGLTVAVQVPVDGAEVI
ncbi:MAG: ATP-binding protein [Aquabacterium sp.]